MEQMTPKLSGLKQQNVVSRWVRNPSVAYLLPFGSGSLTQGCHEGAGQDCSHPRLSWKRICLRDHAGGCWQTLGSHWLLAEDTSFLQLGPLHGAADNRETQQGRSQTFNNLILGMTSIIFAIQKWCHKFDGSNSLGPAYIQGKGVTEGCDFQEVRMVEATWRLTLSPRVEQRHVHP